MKTRRRISGLTAVAMMALAFLSGCAEKPEALVASAKEFLAKNDRAAAIVQLKNALQESPDLAEARFLLGKAELETGQTAAAQKELRKAMELKYSPDDVIPLLAEAVLRSGDTKKVVDEFGAAEVTTSKARAELQTILGGAYFSLRNFDASQTAFAAAIAAVPDHAPALLGQAQLVAARGDLPGAMTLVETSLAKSPSLVDGWRFKGELLVAQGQVEPGLAAYHKAIEIDPNQIPTRAAIVLLLLQQKNTDEADKEFSAMKKIAPTNPQTLYLEALLAYRGKDYPRARDAIQRHLKAAPGSLPGVLLGAQIDYELGDYATAEAALGTVLQRAPRNALARQMLVQTMLRNGRPPAKAIEALQPLLQGAKPDSNTLALAGEVYARSGDAKTAARYFEQAAALDPENTSRRTALALSHMAQGETARGLSELEAAAANDEGIKADLALIASYVRQRKFDAALTAVAAVEKKRPDTALSHSLRGGVLAAKRDFVGARRAFERALSVDPTYFPAAQTLAQLDLMDKKPEDARKRFEAILAKNPKSVPALLAIAALRTQAGGSSEEIAALIGRAIDASPNDVNARLSLIRHYIQTKEYKKAVAAAQDAVAAVPDRAEILDAAATAYRASGDVNQAIATYNKLARLLPDSEVPLLRIAETQVAVKDYPAALESARKALAVKPGSLNAQRMILALEVQAGRGPEALATARAVQKQRPNESIGYLLEGDLHLRQRAFAEAATAYRNGLKNAGTTDLAIRLKFALDAGVKNDAGEKFATSWLKDHPRDLSFRHFLGEQSIAKKDYALAIKQYSTIIEMEPNDVPALNNLAWISGQQKDPKAVTYAERAYAIAPGSAAIGDTYGMLLMDRGEVARGLELLQNAVAIAPNDAGIRLHLAQALIRAGQKDAAKKELEILAKLGDKFPEQAEVSKLMQGI